MRTYVRLALAGVLGAVATGLLVVGLEALGVDGERWSGAFTELALGGVVFLVLCFGAAHLMRVDEVGQLFDPLVRRLRRRPS
jgi:putative peptidoglycan lipid II flippase